MAMARVRESYRDPHGALDLLSEAERLYAGGFFLDVRPIAALRTNIWVVQSRLAGRAGLGA